MELNFKGLEIEKWNIPTDTAQRLDKKIGFNGLLIMFTSRVMVINMSAMALFVSFADNSKKSVTTWPKYLRGLERSYLVLLQNAMDY